MEWDKDIAANIEQISDGEQPPAHLLMPALAELNRNRRRKQTVRRRFIVSFTAAAAALFLCVFMPIALWQTFGSSAPGNEPSPGFVYTVESLNATTVSYDELPQADTTLFPTFYHVFGDRTEAVYTLYTLKEDDAAAYAEMRSRRISAYGYEEIFIYTVYTSGETDIFDAYQTAYNADGIGFMAVQEGGEYTLRLTFMHGERLYYMTVLSANPFDTAYYYRAVEQFK